MRHAPLALLLAVATAHADPEARAKAEAYARIERNVRMHLVSLAHLDHNPNLSENAILVLPDGTVADLAAEGCTRGLANAFYGCYQGHVDHAVGKVIVTLIGPGLGWFLAPYKVTMTPDQPPPDDKPTVYDMRLGGVIVGEGVIWDIRAGMYTQPISDKALLARDDPEDATLGGKPKLTGEQVIARSVADWFRGGLAPNAAHDHTQLLAAGTASDEVKTGAGAIALAKQWDKLRLELVELDASRIKDGVGFVHGTVAMPKKSGKGAVAMHFSAVVVIEGQLPSGVQLWHWTLLQFQASPER